MPMFTLSIYQLLPLLVIVLLLILQQRAIKKGQLVKVQYSKEKRLFWALLSASLVAANAIILIMSSCYCRRSLSVSICTILSSIMPFSRQSQTRTDGWTIKANVVGLTALLRLAPLAKACQVWIMPTDIMQLNFARTSY